MRKVILAACVLIASAGAALAGRVGWAADPEDAIATGRNVLVVYAADDEDRDGSGKPDSLDAAEYYAARRAVPGENLLGVKLRENGGPQPTWNYANFYKRILTPVSEKLAAKSADGQPFSARILYIATMPGLPMTVLTGHADEKNPNNWFGRTTQRSVDQFLISIDANMKVGLEEGISRPGKGVAGPLGAAPQELVLPIFGVYQRPDKDKTFKQLRQEQPAVFNFYLVSRLGPDLATARNMIDGAAWAERFLRLGGPDEKTEFRPAIWLDQKFDFGAHDHVGSLARTLAIVQGVPGAPFSIGKGLNRPWPLVVDNQSPEIGLEVGGVQHMPIVTGTISLNGVDDHGVTLEPTTKGGGGRDVPSVLYFPPGGTVTNGNARARIVGIDAAKNRLLLDSTKGFNAADAVTWTWPGKFPADDCFIFYGFYGLGQYEDVFKFPPGAIGIHVDSSCMNWATHAMQRGMAATFGVTSEPLSIGIPYGDLLLMGLSAGQNWADSAYGALRLSQRWAGVVFGDPLYAPFRSLQVEPGTPPVIGPVTIKPAAAGEVLVAASLAGKSEDELAEVAVFKVEFGPAADYGRTIDFFDWPQPAKSKGAVGRRFGYSRHFSTRLTGLTRGSVYHYRLTARDPAGLQTRTEDRTFIP